jgi:hypothetical protein
MMLGFWQVTLLSLFVRIRASEATKLIEIKIQENTKSRSLPPFVFLYFC